jgi:hypothetical protein
MMPLAVVIGLHWISQGRRNHEDAFDTVPSPNEGVHGRVAILTGLDSPFGDGRLKAFNAAYIRSECKSSEAMRISV